MAVLWLAVAAGGPALPAFAAEPAETSGATSLPPSGPFPGMDQSVNVELAAEAGVPARRPFIDVEQWGDLWNLVLLLGGGVCGFIVGRHWDQLWGRPR